MVLITTTSLTIGITFTISISITYKT